MKKPVKPRKPKNPDIEIYSDDISDKTLQDVIDVIDTLHDVEYKDVEFQAIGGDMYQPNEVEYVYKTKQHTPSNFKLLMAEYEKRMDDYLAKKRKYDAWVESNPEELNRRNDILVRKSELRAKKKAIEEELKKLK